MKIKENVLRTVAMIMGSILTMISLGGCKASEAEPEKSMDTGVILEVTDSGVYVASEGIESATYVAFDGVRWQDAKGRDFDKSLLAPGQQIQYNWTSALETWPASLEGCDQVTVTGEMENVTALLEQWSQAQADLKTDTDDDFQLPVLQVVWTDEKISHCVMPLKGSTVWTTDESALCQESLNPVYWSDEHLVSVDSGCGVKVQLQITGADRVPDTLRVLRWDRTLSQENSLPDEEKVDVDKDGRVTVSAGGIYEVVAEWKGEFPYGSISWGFRVD